MVIRELLDRLDREIESHNQAILRLKRTQDEVRGCCRDQLDEARQEKEAKKRCQSRAVKRAA